MIRKNNKIIKENGQLLTEILKMADLSQRICSLNMGHYANYLVNYIYKYEGSIFPRSFSYLFLSSVYHSLNRDDQNKNRNTKFKKILNEVKGLNVYDKLLMPALEHHILGITKIEKEVFNKDQEEILENYITQIYDKEKVKEYKDFLAEQGFERTGFQNLSNLKGSLDELQEKEYRFNKEELERFKNNLNFEKQTKLIQDFYLLCETLRRKLIPNFYSPADLKEITLQNSELSGFLVKRNIINKLVNSNKTLGGQFVWKSGYFSFEPEGYFYYGKWIPGKKPTMDMDDILPGLLGQDIYDQEIDKDFRKVFGKKEEPTLFEIDALINKHGWKPMLIERLKSNGYGSLIPAEFEKKSPSLFDQDIPLNFQDLKKLA